MVLPDISGIDLLIGSSSLYQHVERILLPVCKHAALFYKTKVSGNNYYLDIWKTITTHANMGSLLPVLTLLNKCWCSTKDTERAEYGPSDL